MSELKYQEARGRNFRWQLFSTVSALTLLSSAMGVSDANAGSEERPTVWIELGGQLERQTGQGDPYIPSFVNTYSGSSAFSPDSPFKSERAPLNSEGAEAKLSIQPNSSDWIWSAAVRYGRSSGNKDKLQKDKSPRVKIDQPFYRYPYGEVLYTRYETLNAVNFSEVQAKHAQSHVVLDFQVGKDVGLGLLGKSDQTTFGLGVRFAQFISKSSTTLHAKPDVERLNGFPTWIAGYFPSVSNPYLPYTHFHTFAATAHASRSFHGIGPSLSATGSVPFLGNRDSQELTVDWGVNAAVLFGRQRAVGSRNASGHYVSIYGGKSGYYTSPANFNRKRSVVVPNVGGFAGISWVFPNAKVSLGYRGDFFFGAMDTGNDDRTTKTVGFYGPYATVSIGFGG